MGASYLDSARLKRSIAAIATAPGTGAISIVRISGDDAVDVGRSTFSRPDVLAHAPSHTLHHGKVVSGDGSIIDDVLVAIMRAPHSYTGENVIEFQTHGGSVQAEAVLRAVLEAGALPALPGEFTFRAFASGRIDLTQAESVADIIAAGTALAARVALQHSDGMLRHELDDLRDALVALRARMEASIDFVDEDIPALEMPLVLRELAKVASRVDGLLDSYHVGRLIRSGARVVISGPPNVGKSSIFNALLRSDRAIVTEIPGTTRDALTEAVDIGGLPVVLADTAGMRVSDDRIEREGVKRSEYYRERADLVIEVREAASGSTAPGIAPAESGKTRRSLHVLNKVDLLERAESARLAAEYPGVIQVSARTGLGIGLLSERIYECLVLEHWREGSLTITRERQYYGLERCRDALGKAVEVLHANAPLEVVAIELRSACAAMEELTGKIYDEDVLNRIFGEFCIGK